MMRHLTFKATKFDEISQILFEITFFYTTIVWRFRHIFVAFSEYMNFTPFDIIKCHAHACLSSTFY